MNMRIIAINTFAPELIIGFKSLSPENVNGPTKTTINPPPMMIKTHIAKMNEKIGRVIIEKLPS